MTLPVVFPPTPALTGDTLSVDFALKNPQLIQKRIANLTQGRLLTGVCFAMLGLPVTGGAVLYERVQAGEGYLNPSRSIEERAPGAAYPTVTAPRGAAKMSLVEDWGGAFPTTDETVERNDIAYLDRQVTILANTLVRKVNQRALAVVEAAVTEDNRAIAVPGWAGVQLSGATPTDPLGLPASGWALAQSAVDELETGITYDTLVVHPQQNADLKIAYQAALPDVLDAAGLEVFVTNLATPGAAYLVASGKLGFVAYERPLTVERWRDPAHRTEWTQAYIQPVCGVTNPYAVTKLTLSP